MENIQAVLVALRRLIRAADIHSKRLVKTTGLTSPQLLLLQALRDHNEMTVGALAQQINLSQATVTTIINRLEGRGLLFRERSPVDKRKVFVYLADKGRETLLGAPAALQEQFVERYQKLDSWEQLMILSSLERVAKMMDAETLDAAPFIEVGDLEQGFRLEVVNKM